MKIFRMQIKDGNTLYFASEGHSVWEATTHLKSEWNDAQKAWSDQNLGYQLILLTIMKTLHFRGDGVYAYVSTIKDGGLGDRDIYKIKFNDVDTRYCIITAM